MKVEFTSKIGYKKIWLNKVTHNPRAVNVVCLSTMDI
jgi:hypothetical protein